MKTYTDEITYQSPWSTPRNWPELVISKHKVDITWVHYEKPHNMFLPWLKPRMFRTLIKEE